MRKKTGILILAAPCCIVLLVLFILPMVYVLISTLREDGIRYFVKFLTDTFYLGILWDTVWVSILATAICLLVGYPVAYFLARTKSKAKNLLLIATVFPFLVSAVVRAYGWMVVLGQNGLLNQLLQGIGLTDGPLSIMYTWKAVLIGVVHLLLPYMILSITSVIQSIDENVEYAAHSLGASPVQTFFKVTLPLSAPGIVSGCILVFTLSMTSYVTPKLLGGVQFRMMSTMVNQEVNVNFNWSFASAISYILLFCILVFQVVATLATGGVLKRVGGAKSA